MINVHSIKAQSRETSSRVRSIGSLALGLLLSTLLVACNNVPDVIKIGVAQPLTGNLAALGTDMLNGVKLAVDEINKQGLKVKGKTVTLEVVAVDDRASADTGKEVAKQLVDAGVVAVVGHLNSGVSIAAAPTYAAANIAQLAISTNPKYTELGFPTTFRLVANDTLQAKAIGSFAASQLSATKFATADDGTAYGKDLAAGATAQLVLAKKTVVFHQSFDDKTTAFADFAKKLKDGEVTVLVTTLNDFQVLALLEELRKIDYIKNMSIMGGDTIKTTLMLKAASMGAAGIYASSPIVDAGELVAGKEFLAKYQAAYKIEPAYAGHYTYDATYAIVAAIKKTESADPAKITASLRKLDAYAPVTGSLKFDDKGEQRYGAIGIYRLGTAKWDPQVRSDAW
jgi:branched-chain amino acid transport system substrate-binding protein